MTNVLQPGPGRTSLLVVLAGLGLLLVTLPWWLYLNTASLGIAGSVAAGGVVPALLLRACWRKTRNWSGITALCMIPLACIGVMDVIADLENPTLGLIIAVESITVFLAVLDAGRRAPA